MPQSDEKPILSPEELIAKGICPVKPEYIRQISKVVQDAVTGAGQGTNGKSKSKIKKERKQHKKLELCQAYLSGTCRYEEKCRFNHDIETFAKQKPEDLPGSCPFLNTGSCPYGISCRWAGSHTFSSPSQDILNKVLKEKKSNGSDHEVTSTVTVPQVEVQDVRGGKEATGDTVLIPSRDGCIELSVASVVDKTINNLEKDLQSKLWKGRYDFQRADNVLHALGLRIGHKIGAADQKRRSQNPDGEEGQVGGKRSKTEASGAVMEDGCNGVASVTPAAGGGSSQDCLMAAEELERETMQASKDPGSTSGTCPDSAAVDVSQPLRDPELRTEGSDFVVSSASGTTSYLPTPHTAEPYEAIGVSDGQHEHLSSKPHLEDKALWRHVHTETLLRTCEKKVLDFRGKSYLAPLTTVGNLPFRRICKGLGADITCGEMAMATNLLQGQASEWALLKRHPCEDIFGVQICGGYPDALARTAQLIDENLSVDFVDVNMGCPIDIVCDRSAGSSLLLKPKRIEEIARAMSRSMDCPLTLKTRKGYYDGNDMAHTFIPQVRSWGAVALTLHGRTRQQRYSRQADWEYISKCGRESPDLQLIGNGDVFSYEDWNAHLTASDSALSTCMIGRGALIKPWIFTEIKEQRHWDISAGERFDLIKKFCSHGLEHWGSDARGVENTRRFLLEWLSYLCRYVPVGLLEVVPQQLHWRPPPLKGRNDLETLLSSDSAADWVRISEMLLGPVPEGFTFSPKHKSSSYTEASAVEHNGKSSSYTEASAVEHNGKRDQQA
ncbi:hypothetical protein CEUSTIGMA_g6701.t1 [Chlamydomonas eustigma]|uniref:tRNA-dihydrouridine(47) synthase [NAD(P)(+)] n=1 Tax=Chlamydomonas eustigma TaxID=1157962 RepID=A0A250X852_9CHLO|nr:hypothetical protein CEUSTIGMA_g6701.t1 [Chlamydomonas eustigma]|eukprot:GAX79261.1 hypothetical protein CEUSTIGMA_g6701.t1 [Chlamydomonas eustigma]